MPPTRSTTPVTHCSAPSRGLTPIPPAQSAASTTYLQTHRPTKPGRWASLLRLHSHRPYDSPVPSAPLSLRAEDRAGLVQVLRSLQHPPSIHPLPNSAYDSFYLSPFRLIFVLEKTPSRHSPLSSRKRGGSGNPGTLLKWIPAFAGMTACVRESGERGAGNLKKTIGAIPSRSTLPVDIVYVDPYFSRMSGCRHLRAAWSWPDASTGYSHPVGAGRRPRFARW